MAINFLCRKRRSSGNPALNLPRNAATALSKSLKIAFAHSLKMRWPPGRILPTKVILPMMQPGIYPKNFSKKATRLRLFSLGLPDTNLSQLRVIDRTKEGGHYVEPATLKDNFYGNLEKLDVYYSLFHTVRIFDTSLTEHTEVALVENNKVIFAETVLPVWFTENLENITALIRHS